MKVCVLVVKAGRQSLSTATRPPLGTAPCTAQYREQYSPRCALSGSTRRWPPPSYSYWYVLPSSDEVGGSTEVPSLGAGGVSASRRTVGQRCRSPSAQYASPPAGAGEEVGLGQAAGRSAMRCSSDTSWQMQPCCQSMDACLLPNHKPQIKSRQPNQPPTNREGKVVAGWRLQHAARSFQKQYNTTENKHPPVRARSWVTKAMGRLLTKAKVGTTNWVMASRKLRGRCGQ